MNLEELKKVVEKATPQNLDSAEITSHYESGERILDCPFCDGEGSVEEEAYYCNYDGKALGVQFFGIGPEHGAAEQYLRTFNPSLVSKLLRVVEAAKLFNEERPMVIDCSNELTELEEALQDLERS